MIYFPCGREQAEDTATEVGKNKTAKCGLLHQFRTWGPQAYGSPHSLASPLHGPFLEVCEKDRGQGMAWGRLEPSS